MKKFLNVLMLCFLTTGIMMACPPEGEKKAENTETETNVEGTFASLNLDVKGMTCGGCENKVKAALTSIDGVVETKKVCSESDKAVLTYDPTVTTEEQIVEALTEKTGYSYTMIKSAAVSSDAKVKSDVTGEKKACTKAQKAACAKSKAACSKSKASTKTEKVLEEQ